MFKEAQNYDRRRAYEYELTRRGTGESTTLNEAQEEQIVD